MIPGNVSTRKRICLVPKFDSLGGMASFQHKLAQGLSSRNIDVSYNLEDEPYQAVLVIGGTRNLPGLWRVRKKGIRIIQRLNGRNWIHRRRRTGVKHYLRAEYGNILLSFIRSSFINGIVYQSQFAQTWWEREAGVAPVPACVIYNGINLVDYSSDGPHQRPEDHCRLLLVEGSLVGGYEVGLEIAFQLAEKLHEVHHQKIELTVVGRVNPDLQKQWKNQAHFPLSFAGKVSRENIPEIDRSAHLLFSADLNAACPNSVIEALACGLPVLAFDTGALPELVTGDAGRIISYGSNPWMLEPPDVDGLARGALEILANQALFRIGARQRAEAAFSLDNMVEAYLEVLIG